MPMKITTVDEMKIVGLSALTSFKEEGQPETSKIGPLIQEYLSQNVASQIPCRKSPGRTFAIYTEYTSDEHGEYRYVFGEEVTAFDNVPESLHCLTIPAGKFQCITTDPGVVPAVIINAWQAIWKLSPEELGGERAFRADFEVYDERASDPDQTVLDIYVGLK